MKFKLLMLGICVLFTSCFSYKNMNGYDEMVMGKKYKVLMKDSTKYKIRAIRNDSILVGKTSSGGMVMLPTERILWAKKRKLSTVKTAAIPVSIGGGILIAALIVGDTSIDVDW